MDDVVKKYKIRRDARIKKRMDDEWITIKGTHVMVDDDKKITKGPERLKSGPNRVAPAKNLPSKESTPLRNGSRTVSSKKGSGETPSTGAKKIGGETRSRKMRSPSYLKISDGMTGNITKDINGEWAKNVNEFVDGTTFSVKTGNRWHDEVETYTRTPEGWSYERTVDGKSMDKWDSNSKAMLSQMWNSINDGIVLKQSEKKREGVQKSVKESSSANESEGKKPRPRSKLEVMKQSKDNYSKVQEEIKSMKPGIERDVKEKLILPWIKGTNWMGGISDSKFSQIAKRMPYSFDDVYNEFQKQMMKY